MDRLDAKSPALASSLRRATAETKRKIVLLASSSAVSSTGVKSDDVPRALELIGRGAAADTELVSRLRILADAYDAEYLKEEDRTTRIGRGCNDTTS
jgi:hypothetical protein